MGIKSDLHNVSKQLNALKSEVDNILKNYEAKKAKLDGSLDKIEKAAGAAAKDAKAGKDVTAGLNTIVNETKNANAAANVA